MALPHNYEDSIRKHDVAIYSWLDGLHVDYGTVSGVERNDCPILRTFAAPHRAFAQAHDTLVKMGWVAGETDEAKRIVAEADWSVLPLPFVTIDRDDPIFSPQLAAPVLNVDRWFKDPTTGAWVELPYPLHMLTTYRLTFWCLKRYTEAFIMEWFYSRFGARGAGPQEVYLTVRHDAPWGEQRQALRWVGSADYSDLEGENPRYIRMTASLIFRTWLMRGSWAGASREQPVHTIRRTAPEEPNLTPTASWWGSGNLFEIDMALGQIPTAWPKTGAASVVGNGRSGLVLAVDDDTDTVGLCTRGAVPNGDGYEILGLSALVDVGGAPVRLLLCNETGDPTATPKPVPTPVYHLDLPVGSHRFHEFTLSRGDRFTALLHGTGGPADVEIEQVDIRHIEPALIVKPEPRDDLGAAWGYRILNLSTKPHLVVVVLQLAVAGETVTFEDSAFTPSFTRSRVVSETTEIGVVSLIQPKTDSLRVVVPKSMIIADVYAQVFDGPYLGSTLLA